MLAVDLWHIIVGVTLLRLALPIGRYAVIRARGEGGVILLFAVLMGGGGAALISESFGRLPWPVSAGICMMALASAIFWRPSKVEMDERARRERIADARRRAYRNRKMASR
jgi:hypothetical protein